jgi:hypothetical protein
MYFTGCDDVYIFLFLLDACARDMPSCSANVSPLVRFILLNLSFRKNRFFDDIITDCF